MKKSKVIFLALLACAFGASARTVTFDEATQAARGWVRRGKTLGVKFPSQVAQTAVLHSTTNGVKFYTVKMEKGGTVFTSGDTEFEPIIGFTAATNDFSTIEKKSPLWALLNHDISQKKPQSARPQLAFSTAAATVQQKPKTATELKWESLIKAGAALPPGPIPRLAMSAAAIKDEEDIDDLRVPALVKSQWSQGEVWGQACYNYYTPPGPDGSADNAVCGCVATAMSQIMRYFQYPNAAVAPVTHTCSYNGDPIDLTTQGGLYDWANMPLVPAIESFLSEEQCQAIGKLTSDAGISVWMSYSKAGSGAYTPEGGTMMREVFGYKNAVSYVNSDWYFYPQLIEDGGAVRAETLQRTMFVNFDAGNPVLVSIPGHAVVADGYGYVDEVDYVHFNMGWAGQCDWWYNIPDLTEAGYDAVNIITYNLFTNAAPTCAIMSGRIVDDDGIAIADADVTISDVATGNVVMETKTNERGIWSAVLEAGTYDVLATRGKLMAELDEVVLNTPESSPTHWVNCNIELVSPSSPAKLGNSWGNDMVLAEPTARIIVDAATTNLYTSLDKALRAATNGNETVEILLPTILKKPVTLEADCTIVATNANAVASAVTCRKGAKITIADGATVTMTNVFFDMVEKAKTVVVGTNGVLKIGGVCGLEAVETICSNNLVVVDELRSSFFVDCVTAKNDGEVFAMSALPRAETAAFANRLLEYDAVYLGGEAQDDGGRVVLKWLKDVPVPDDRAYGRLNGKNYRSLDYLFQHYDSTKDAEIVIFKSTEFKPYVEPHANLIMRGEGDVCPVLTVTGTSGFRILEGGSLTISKLVFTGYVDADTSDYCGFIGIDGGELTLDDGTTLDGMTGHVNQGSGIVDLLAGTVTMRKGAAIINCAAMGRTDGAGRGGAIYTSNKNVCVLNLEGGVIADCVASSYGGGIYVDDWYGQSAIVNLSGELVVSNNWSAAAANDDICLATTRVLPNFRLAGPLSGTNVVGVWVSTPVGDEIHYKSGINAEGKPFGTNAVGAVVSASAFFNDTDDTLTGALGDDGMLVWTKKPLDDGTCDENLASAHVYVLDGDGREIATNHYANLSTALIYMTPGTTNRIEMYLAGYDGEYLSDDVIIPDGCHVGILANPPQSFTISRFKSSRIEVPKGTQLVLQDIVVDRDMEYYPYPNGVTNALLDVAGGTLELANGACVSNILGNSSRDAAAVAVHNGGIVVMREGSKVVKCENCYNYKLNFETTDKNYGCGGGLLVDDGKAFLHGGEIAGCIAVRGGGVYACNDAEVYISGDMRIKGNLWQNTNGVRQAGNVFVADQATVYLDGALTEKIGMGGSPWLTKDTNLVAEVSYVWTNDVAALAKSGTNFVHDVTGEMGVAVTNGTGALIVWCGAVKGAGVYVKDNVTYRTTDLVPASDPEPDSTLLPEVADIADVPDELAKLKDNKVAENVATMAQYDDFRIWAQNVEGGKDAVAASDNAHVSYEFGTTNLFKNEPAVEITEVAGVDGGLTLSVVVMDGDGDAMAVASAKVAKMFEGTSDLSDWTSTGKKLDLTADAAVTDLTKATEKKVEFNIKPVGAPSKVFIRLKY